MKLLAVVVLSLMMAAFISQKEQKPLPLKLSLVSKKIAKPAIIGQHSKDECRVAFLLNPSKTDSAYVGVKSCEGVEFGIGIVPGGYVITECLSTDYGVQILEGDVVVDWMQICP